MTEFRNRLTPLLLLAAIVALWFWPVTLTGKRPAGGDLTTLFLPQMTQYAEAVKSGRVPLWNEKSGLGSPMLAQGQVGVLYPVHQVLYRLLSPSDATTASMLLHVGMAACFAYLCARSFELSPRAAMLAGLVFSGQGFFVGHLTQPWSFMTGAWLPLVVACAWQWLRRGDWRWLFGLAAALSMQLLAGHFQVAFFTVELILGLAVASFIAPNESRGLALIRGLLMLVGIAAAAAMAAAQLLPSAELILRADLRDRGIDYASLCSSSPLLLVSYLAPTLLRMNPLWEPTVWIPGKTNANESLMWVGLVPLALAVWTMVAARHERVVRILSVLAVLSLLFCLGTTLPGFRSLASLPGFGWFTAPARWSIVTGLLVALLAGRGVDQIDPKRFLKASRILIPVAAVLLTVLVTTVVAYVRSTDSFRDQPEPFLRLKLKHHGYSEQELFEKPVTPSSELASMLAVELILPVATGTLLFVLALTRIWPRNRERFATLVIGWTAIELGLVFSLLSPVRFEPRSPPLADSKLLTEIARRKPDRVAGTVGRLPMLAGTSTFSQPPTPAIDRFNKPGLTYVGESYATIPESTRFGDMAYLLGYSGNAINEDHVEFMRVAGIRMLVLGSSMNSVDVDEQLQRSALITDSHATIMRFDPSLVQAGPPAVRWQILELKPDVTVSRAWLFPVSDPAEAGTDPRLLMRPPPARRGMLDKAVPVTQIDDDGEVVTIEGNCPSRSVLVLADRFYAGWTATLKQSGKTERVPIERAFRDWRGVVVPEPGPFTLTFRFEPRSFIAGTRISWGALVLWLAGFGLSICVTCQKQAA